MNFDFSEKEKTFLAQVSNTMAAFSKAQDLESGDPSMIRNHLTDSLAVLAPLDYLKIGLLKEGAPLSGTLALMAAMEQLSGIAPSIFLSVEMSTRLFGRILRLQEPADDRPKIVEKLALGEVIGAVALSESAMNVENDPLATIGIREGGRIAVSGAKSYVVNGPIADWFAVVGRLDDQTAVYLIEKETPGLTLTERIETMGYDGLAICGLELDSVMVPESHIIGPIETNRCLDLLKLWENQILIAAALGMMKSSFEAARDYAKSHRSGGKPVIAYQEVGFKLSEMLTLYQTSQLYAYRAAWMADEDPKEAGVLTLCAKVFCTEAAESVAGKALQILSGEGYRSGGAAERAYRCAKFGQIAGISTEIARVRIGDAALGRR
ncbi:acyl-CoA dehydrogenase [uncultured Desulfosarcina sp.]|uniref:acyl-CoA dehydrogenase family protein n=1 Tax=uncultured Desulfosarcina sp. TaxID=218289 RepID=UPI0029C8B154|nr:acyl-CoA dehydrogenase [uncultured Desulfosarcina sp.]